MAKQYAVRNISLCTKDCLCLYVCPTGASDTEDSIIDTDKCVGCGACANACPSKAISMVPTSYPPQQKHDEDVLKAMKLLFASKSKQENIAHQLPNKLAMALEKSNRIMAEDVIREAGYMLPQSANTRLLLEALVQKNEGGTAAAELLELLQTNEKMPEKATAPETWKCSICGYIHEGAMPEGFACPLCKQPASAFVKQ